MNRWEATADAAPEPQASLSWAPLIEALEDLERSMPLHIKIQIGNG